MSESEQMRFLRNVLCAGKSLKVRPGTICRLFWLSDLLGRSPQVFFSNHVQTLEFLWEMGKGGQKDHTESG